MIAKLKYMYKKDAAKKSRGKKKSFQKLYYSEKKEGMTEAGFEPSTSRLVSLAHQLLSQTSTSINWHI